LTPIFIISAVVTPFFGFIIDKIGKIGYFMLTSLILFLCSHILFVVFPENIEIIYALIPMIIMGLFYATYAAVFWPCIPLVVDKRLVGTAYGVVILINTGKFYSKYFFDYLSSYLWCN
jgi:hypothetical protein